MSTTIETPNARRPLSAAGLPAIPALLPQASQFATIEHYRKLVHDLADGSDIEPPDIRRICWDVGKSMADLRRDVASVRDFHSLDMAVRNTAERNLDSRYRSEVADAHAGLHSTQEELHKLRRLVSGGSKKHDARHWLETIKATEETLQQQGLGESLQRKLQQKRDGAVARVQELRDAAAKIIRLEEVEQRYQADLDALADLRSYWFAA